MRSTRPLTFSTLASISASSSVKRMFLTKVPRFKVTEVPFTFRSLIKVTESPSGYYGYRYGMYGWGAGVSTSVDNYTEGTLNIDVVDSATSRLLWEGVAVGRINEKSRDDPQPAIDEVVRQVFEKFPKQPATAPQT